MPSLNFTKISSADSDAQPTSGTYISIAAWLDRADGGSAAADFPADDADADEEDDDAVDEAEEGRDR